MYATRLSEMPYLPGMPTHETSSDLRAAMAAKLAIALAVVSTPALSGTVLFDASHRQNAGNADWVIDADTFDLAQPHFPCGPGDVESESNAQRVPTPPAAGIDASTPETYWTGGISAFGVDLVKLGHAVETLPEGADITFGDGGNPQDLGNYDVFILPEPNRPYDPLETTAILDFVAAGGGLFLIADHQTSDRDCDGADSPHILNDLMGVVISGGQIADFGLMGVVFNVEEIAGQTGADYWFTDAIDDNVSTDPADPIISGPHGSGTGGLGLFGATAMTIDVATNPTVRGHVWKSEATGQGATRVTFATASYGGGRVAMIGDSSPADDGTGDPSDNLYFGWDGASGGVGNKEIHLNAVEWLAGPDLDAPQIIDGPSVSVADCSVVVSWTTDEASDSRIEYGPDPDYGDGAATPELVVNHELPLGGLLPLTTYHYRVGGVDGADNGPTWSADASIETTDLSSPTITSGPEIVALSNSSASIAWSTDELADSRVDYGLTPSYSNSESSSGLTRDHVLVLADLVEATEYHFRVVSSDACGTPPTVSDDATFETADGQIDLSGWTLEQFDSSQSYTLPVGTTLAAGGHLVLARDASLASFEAEWGPLAPGTVFLSSDGTFPFINGGESFRLLDPSGVTIDGVTISMSAGTSIQRVAPALPAGDPAAWTVTGAAGGGPGESAGRSSGGVVISEASDASSFPNEFVELFHAGLDPEPDATPPSAISDLVAEPLSGSGVRLAWTAPGDDATNGTAASYGIRHGPRPLLTESDFSAASPVAGTPLPSVAGSSESLVVRGLSPDTTYHFAIVAFDEAGNASSLSNSPGATTGPAGSGTGGGADHLVISEVQTRGASSNDDEFIELYNPTGAAVGLGGRSVQYKSAAGSSFLATSLPAVSLPAGGYFLIARPPGDYDGPVAADLTQTEFLMAAAGGHVFLVDGIAPLGSCVDRTIIDKVGYGTADCPESAQADAPAAGGSVERRPGAADPRCGNGSDTDDNAVDFEPRALSEPQNSSSVETPCAGLGNVGDSLYAAPGNGGTFRWAAALGAQTYKVRRGGSPDFMQTDPLPGDANLLLAVGTPEAADPEVPLSGEVYYYFVNAQSAGAESPD